MARVGARGFAGQRQNLQTKFIELNCNRGDFVFSLEKWAIALEVFQGRQSTERAH